MIQTKNLITPTYNKKSKFEQDRLHKKLRKYTTKAICDFNMIQKNDLIMLCLSGGKDSYTLLNMLLCIKRSSSFDFKIRVVNLDQGQPGFSSEKLKKYLEQKNVEFDLIKQDTYSVIMDKIPKEKTKCSLCSRLRRGALYAHAKKIKATKIALGHHKDDIIETMFLNMFYNGQLKAMPAKYKTDNKEHIVIRPLAYCAEQTIIKYANLESFPIIPCNLCGTQNNMQRQNIKEMLNTWQKQNPGRVETIFSAMQNIKPAQMLDKKLFNFKNI